MYIGGCRIKVTIYLGVFQLKISNLMPARIIDNKLHVDGYIYLQNKIVKGKVYSNCRLGRNKECSAGAITTDLGSSCKIYDLY